MAETINRWLTKSPVTPSYPDQFTRWQSINSITPVSKAGTYITVPAFSIAAGAEDVNYILSCFNYISPNNFSILNYFDVTVSGFTLCVVYVDSDHSVHRFKLAGDVNLPLDVADYRGQRIKPYFRIEIWGNELAGATNASDITLVTSVKSSTYDTANGGSTELATGVFQTNMHSLNLDLPLEFEAGAQPVYNA